MSQLKTKIATLVIGALSTVPVATATIASFQQPAHAATFCQCVQYVRNRFGLPSPSGNANQWNDGYLQRNGFRAVSARPGAIVVFENTFPGVNRTYGHVGVVQSIDSSGRVTVRGSNQGGNTTEFNCNNVNSITLRTSINGRNDVSFWVR